MSSVRIEHKYLISNQQYISLKGIFSAIFKEQSEHLNAYPIISLYYDTPNRDYFFQKVNGEQKHLKIRIRKYTNDFNNLSPSWLETKIKVNDRITKKRQLFESKDNILSPQDWPLSTHNDLLIQRAHNTISPSCYIRYDREAFEMLYKKEKLRITFDHNIMAYKPSEKQKKESSIFSQSSPKKIIMEIKYHQELYPSFLQQILQQYSLKRVYFSKYAEGLNFLNQIC